MVVQDIILAVEEELIQETHPILLEMKFLEQMVVDHMVVQQV